MGTASFSASSSIGPRHSRNSVLCPRAMSWDAECLESLAASGDAIASSTALGQRDLIPAGDTKRAEILKCDSLRLRETCASARAPTSRTRPTHSLATSGSGEHLRVGHAPERCKQTRGDPAGHLAPRSRHDRGLSPPAVIPAPAKSSTMLSTRAELEPSSSPNSVGPAVGPAHLSGMPALAANVRHGTDHRRPAEHPRELIVLRRAVLERHPRSLGPRYVPSLRATASVSFAFTVQISTSHPVRSRASSTAATVAVKSARPVRRKPRSRIASMWAPGRPSTVTEACPARASRAATGPPMPPGPTTTMSFTVNTASCSKPVAVSRRPTSAKRTTPRCRRLEMLLELGLRGIELRQERCADLDAQDVLSAATAVGRHWRAGWQTHGRSPYRSRALPRGCRCRALRSGRRLRGRRRPCRFRNLRRGCRSRRPRRAGHRPSPPGACRARCRRADRQRGDRRPNRRPGGHSPDHRARRSPPRSP